MGKLVGNAEFGGCFNQWEKQHEHNHYLPQFAVETHLPGVFYYCAVQFSDASFLLSGDFSPTKKRSRRLS